MKRALSLTSGPIPGLIWQIAIPSSVGMFFNTMYNIADTYCAGLLSTDALAGLSLSFSVFFALISVGSGLMQGTIALLANALGRGDRVDARGIFAQSIVLVLILGLLVSFVGWLATPWLFQQLGAQGAYLEAGLRYMNVIYAGGVFFLLTMTLNSVLAAQGNTRVYRNFLMVSFLANCALNPILMWGLLGMPKMGVEGIALATVMVQMGGCFWMWKNVAATELFGSLDTSDLKINPILIQRILAQSLPAALNMLTIAVGIFVITRFVQPFGREAVAAMGIATRIEQVVLLPVIGLSSAILSLVGQNHGAGLPHRVREAWATSTRQGVLLMVIGGFLVWLLRDSAMRLFTADHQIISDGSLYLLAAALTLGAYPILFGTVFLMQGLKRPLYGLWVGLYRQLIAPLVLYPLLAFGCRWGLPGVWWGIFLVNWSAALFALWWGLRITRLEPAMKLETIRS